MRGRTRRDLALLLILAGAAIQTGASAGEPTAADRETARTLLLDGRAKLKAGDPTGALKSFQAAHAIMRVPTTGLDLAKAQAALGMLVEALATAREVARMEEKAGEPEAFREAREAAGKLVEELSARIPSLEIRIEGLPAGATPEVTVDGVALPAETVGLPRKVNPGEHSVEVRARGTTTTRRTVTLQDSQTVPLEVRLAPDPSSAAAGNSGAASARSSAEAPGAPGGSARDGGAGQGAPAWAWASGVGGLVALGAGVAFALDYASVRSTVADDCPGDVCDPQRYDADGVRDLKSRWDRDIGLTVGLGAVALAGVGMAVYGLVSAPREASSDAQAPRQERIVVSPWVGGGMGATLRGTF